MCIRDSYKGSYSKALDYYMKSLNIREEIGDKLGMGYTLNKIGNVHYDKGEYNIAIEYLEKSLSIHIEIGIKILELTSTTILYLTYKHLDKDYDKEQIHTLINNATENIEYELNFRLYELLEDKVYLETTYSQIQEKADSMDDELKEKFINYPIPKQIIEEYKKVFSQ